MAELVSLGSGGGEPEVGQGAPVTCSSTPTLFSLFHLDLNLGNKGPPRIVSKSKRQTVTPPGVSNEGAQG